MAEITYNGVKYTNVPNKKAGTKFAASLTQSNIGASQTIQDYINGENFYPLVNAIDINWNGIEIGENSYINSTSDLVSYISTKGGGSDVDLSSYATITYVTTELDKKADKTELPDMTNYVSITSYNALAARVEELASWIVSYHSTPTPGPTTGDFYFQWADLNMEVNDVVTPPLTNTYAYDSITYISSSSDVFTVDSSGTCTATGGGNATLTAQLYNNTTGEYITETSISVNVSGKRHPIPTGWTYDGQIIDNLTFVIGDSTSTPTTYAFTSTPSDGWEFATTMYDPINGVSIDSTTYNITVTPSLLDTTGDWNMHVERQEDSSYWGGECNMPFVVLAAGTDPTFNFRAAEMWISNEEGTTTRQLYDSIGEIEMYAPTVTSSDTSIVTATVDPNNNSNIIINYEDEGDATVTATITNTTTGVTRTATITVHAVVNREWIDAHLVNASNDDSADNYYGLPKNSGAMTLNFIANRAYGREPLIGFSTTVVGDTYNAITITHAQTTNNDSIAFVVSVDTSKLTNMNDWDVIDLQIERPQDMTTTGYSDQRHLRVIPQGADPGIYWTANNYNLTVGTYYGGGLDIIYNDLRNNVGGTPTITIADPTIAHMDGNSLYGDSVGTTTITATVTDGNNNTRTATITVNVSAGD